MDDIHKILKSYKQRFISPSSRSRTYFLTRLYPDSAIDLVEFAKLFGASMNIVSLIKRHQSLVFSSGKIDATGLKKLLINGASLDEVRKLVPSFAATDYQNLESYRKKIEDINEQEPNGLFIENKTDGADTGSEASLVDYVIELVDKYSKKANTGFLDIARLKKAAENNLANFGKNDLYLGYPFIEGRFITGKRFRAPLILHRVSITQSLSNIRIDLIEGEAIINPVFLVSYFLENNLDHQLFDWSLNEDDFVGQALSVLKQNKVEYEYDPSGAKEFISCSKEDYVHQSPLEFNKFLVLDNVVLGLFPISDKNIYNDLQKLETQDFAPDDSIYKFIYGKDLADSLFSHQEEKRADENRISYITYLDYSQKNALAQALNQNLVIQGPPGTGKSQVLSNIVALYASQGKKVLVVSEKAAALDVIYNRIGKLSLNALLIRDYINDTASFYKQLKDAIYSIKLNSDKDIYPPYKELDSNLENVFNSLENRYDLYSSSYHGFTFLEVMESQDKSIAVPSFIEHYFLSFPSQEDRKALYLSYASMIDHLFKIDAITPLKGLNAVISEETALDITDIKFYLTFVEQMKGMEGYDRVLFSSLRNHYLISNNFELYTDRLGQPKISLAVLEDNISLLRSSHAVEQYKASIEETNKPIYQYIKPDKKGYQLLTRWKQIKKKERVTLIKGLTKDGYSLPFFKKLHPLKALSASELNLYHQIEKDIDTLNPEQLIIEDVDPTTIKVLDYLLKHPEEETQAAAFSLFLEGIYSIDLGAEERVYQSLASCAMRLNSVGWSEKVKALDDTQLRIGTMMAVSGIEDAEKMKRIVMKCLAANDFAFLKDQLSFFENYKNIYQGSIDNISNKIKKTRIDIVNSLRTRISIRGQSDEKFKSDIEEMLRLANFKRMRPIATITKHFSDALLELFPICLMTPGSVSAVLEDKKESFDIVIFDEASQMYVEHAIPSIYRAKSIVVAGDSHQLRPSSFFVQRFAEDEVDYTNNNAEVSAALEEESLLDYAENKFRSVLLRYHYRSIYKELIAFSSYAFYHNKLVFSSSSDSPDKTPIEVCDVNGIWENNINREEAEKTVWIIKNILQTRKHNQTIGVITFNAKQQDLIYYLLEEEATKNAELSKELIRVNPKDGSDDSLFVKNIENVQGDERDIIIFSIGYAKDPKGIFLNNFGPISDIHGENRLNVAITRAKEKIYIVKSIPSSLIKGCESNTGAYLFKKYLEYAEDLNNGGNSNALLDSLCDKKGSDISISPEDTPFRKEVYKYLQDKLIPGYKISKEVQVGSFWLDFIVSSDMKPKQLLGIIVDEGPYSSKASLENDYYRQAYLEGRGWKIYHIWLPCWLVNKEQTVQGVIDSLK